MAELEIQGLVEARGRFRIFARNVQNLGQVHRNIATVLDAWAVRNVRTEGAKLAEGPWKPFKHGGRPMPRGGMDMSAKLLQDTGRLVNGFNVEATEESVSLSNDADYAEHHNTGIRGRLPKRRILPEPGDLDADIKRMYDRHITTSRRRARVR